MGLPHSKPQSNPRTLSLRVSSGTDTGKVRTTNEDALLCDPEQGVFAVCDGVGGEQGGDVASRLAIDTLRAYLKAHAPTAPFTDTHKGVELLRSAIEATNRAILDRASQDTRLQRMATTLSMIWINGTFAYLGHVGDSRVYFMRDGKLSCLTEDHTIANLRKREGRSGPMEPGIARTLYQAIGSTPALSPDVYAVELAPGDRLLICSDGLTKAMRDPEIETRLRITPDGQGTRDLQAILRQMIKDSLDRGGVDNTTMILVEVEAVKSELAEVTMEPPTAKLKVEALHDIHFFKCLSFSETQKLLSISKTVSVHGGQKIFQEGEQGNELWLLLSGEVEISKQGKSEKPKTIAETKSGRLIGESAFFQNGRRTATVIAKNDVKALVFEREAFLRLCRSEPALAINILFQIIGELHIHRDQVLDTYLSKNSKKTSD